MGHYSQVFDFENPENQAKALSIIPVEILEKRAKGKDSFIDLSLMYTYIRKQRCSSRTR
jgi:hypothetical protein